MPHDVILAPTRVLDADEAHHLGSLLASSGYFQDAREAAQAAVKVMAGAELGIGPVASMRGVDIIKGEVSLGAGLVAAIVRRSERYDYDVKAWTDEGCTIVFTRDGKAMNPPITFDKSDAVRAGLANGDNYRKYPKAMYFARAMTAGARAHCPDLFAGSIYTSGELDTQDAALTPTPPAWDATAPEPESPLPAPAQTLDEAITAGDIEVEGALEPEGDRSIGQAAAEATAPTDAPPVGESVTSPEEAKTPVELARSYGIADATQRFILITVAGVEDANDLDLAYKTLNEQQLHAVIAEWKKRVPA